MKSVRAAVLADGLENCSHEAFAQHYAAHGNATRAYLHVFGSGASSRNQVSKNAYALVHTPLVAERVRQLQAQSAELATVSARARMVRLQDICEADPAELVRINVVHCSACYSSPAYAEAWAIATAAALDGGAGDTLPEPLLEGAFDPDRDPWTHCARCLGAGRQVMHVTPTEQLSPGARKLLKAVRQKTTGEIEVQMHDQMQAADMLNRMQAAYIDRSENINLNATVAAPPSVNAADVLDAWRASREGTP